MSQTEKKTQNAETSPELRYGDVLNAARRLESWVHRTPVITCSHLNQHCGHRLFFKCENLQKSGAFKFRGACNALALMTPEDLAKGVVTHSSGNHAGALALAARLFGTQAQVVMPENSLAVKRAAVQEYGGVITSCRPTQVDREKTASEILAATGATLVPPYDHPHIIAGQGTAMIELAEQVSDLDLVIAPVGGGGLLAGTALAAKGTQRLIRVLGAEPVQAADAFQSKQAGQLILNSNPQTIADGLRTNLGSWTWPVIRDLVDDIATVEEAEIIWAMRLFWERTKLLIEPSSAVAVAVALTKLPDPRSQSLRVGVILSGGNVDLDHLPW